MKRETEKPDFNRAVLRELGEFLKNPPHLSAGMGYRVTRLEGVAFSVEWVGVASDNVSLASQAPAEDEYEAYIATDDDDDQGNEEYEDD